MPVIVTAPSRTSKRGDTWEPVTGICYDVLGPADLSGWTLRFLAKATNGAVTWIIDSSASGHGVCVNVTDVDGPGANVSLEWPLGSGRFIIVPANKGRYRYEPGAQGVAQDGLFEIEVECTKTIGGAVKTITFPSREVDNPIWQIDPDIR